MRRFFKLLHTIGSAGLMGGGVALAIVALLGAQAVEGDGFTGMADAMAKIAAWVIAPSMLLVIASGLLSMAITPAFQNAGWVWAKAATGILVFQAGVHVLGPMQGAARAAAEDPDATAQMLTAAANTLWVLLVVSIANLVLAIWRPRFFKPPV